LDAGRVATRLRRAFLVGAGLLTSVALNLGAVTPTLAVSGPAVYGLDVNSGTSAGRTQVRIFGSGFNGATAVNFGTVGAVFFFVNPDRDVIFTQSPAQAAGTSVHVTVKVGAIGSASGVADLFSYNSATAPYVNGVSPHTGSSNGGTPVEIHGSGFSSPDGMTSVRFGTSPALACDASITPTVAHAAVDPTGPQRNSLTTQLRDRAGLASQRDAASRFERNPAQRDTTSIASSGISPAPMRPAVSGGGGPGGPPCQVASDSLLFVTAPPGSLGTVPVTVITGLGSSPPDPAARFTFVAPGPPVVNAVDPHTGSATGNLNVNIIGSGFSGATNVKFGNNAAMGFFVGDDDNISAQLPPQGSGPAVVDVTVTVGANTSATSAADKFTYQPEQKPVIDALIPNHGSEVGGMQVTIVGSSLSGTNAVTFGGMPAQSFFAPSDNELDIFGIPPHAPGAVDVTATDSAGSTTKAAAFTYDPGSAPTVSAVSPNHGPSDGGNALYISGTGFSGINGPMGPAPGAGVFFGGNQAFSAFAITDSVIQVTTVPPGALGATVDVTVTTPSGSAVDHGAYTYGNTPPPLPVLSSVRPSSGAAGSTVYLTGEHLYSVQSLTFGTSSAQSFYPTSQNLILAEVPPQATNPATVSVTVTTAGGVATMPNAFTYSSTPPPSGPVVSGVSPNKGTSAGGTGVQIYGTGFAGATAVTFGGSQVFGFGVSPDGTQIYTTSPLQGGNPATVDVRVTVGSSTSPVNTGDQFTYVPPGQPEVDAVDPTHATAAGGTQVQIYGMNLSNVTAVTFGNTPAQHFCPVCGSDNQTFAISPAGTAGQIVDVRVTTAASVTPSPAGPADKFTFVMPSPPSIVAVEPARGPATGGTQTVIYGSGFSGATSVSFGTNAAGFFVGDDEHVFTNTPPGNPGPVTVKISTPAGLSGASAGSTFTYLQPSPPAVSAVSPNHGTAAGGTNIFISGSGLGGATSVQVGNAILQRFQFFVQDDGLIQAVTPAQHTNPSTVDVRVTTQAGVSAINANDQFTFTPAPTPSVIAVSPAAGPPGTVVFITGVEFGGPDTYVYFGGTPVLPLGTSDGLLKVLSPPSPLQGNGAGPVDVVVVTAGGASAISPADVYTYMPAQVPIVTAVAPNTGPVGTNLYVTGSHLGGVKMVNFGATMSAGNFHLSDTLIFTTSPAGGSGTVDVTVASSVGTSAISNADKYTYTGVGTPPGPPLGVAALAGEASGTVYWSPPTSTGTTPISGYTVTSSPGGNSVNVGASARSATVSGLSDGTAYTFTVTATNASGPGTPSAPSNAVTPGRGQYRALAPARILDTRLGVGAPKAPLGAGSSLTVQITGQGGVPATGVAAVVLNVTVTNTTAGSYLTVWPAGVPRPNASNLNWTAGKTVPNLVEVAVGVEGRVAVFNPAGSTDVIFDVAGYVATPVEPPGADGLYTPVVPQRVLDTRDGTGGVPAGALGPGGTVSVRMNGQAGLPLAGVAAVVLNVTVTGPTQPSYLTVYPTGTPRPNASNLNFVAGQTVPNRVIVKVGNNGTPGWVSFFNAAGSTQVIADIGGWFSDNTNPAASGSRFVGVTPARILDTRDGTGGFHAPIGAGGTIAATVAGVGGVPAMTATVAPRAVVLNVTVTDTTAASFLTVWPDGAPARPNASDLNWVAGLTVPNLVVVKVGSSGKIDLYNPAGSTNVIIDVVGWYG